HSEFEILALELNAEVAQLVEHQPSKLNVAGSNPVFRSKLLCIREHLSLEGNYCRRSSGVERFLGKEEVAGSNPAVGSNIFSAIKPLVFKRVGRLPEFCYFKKLN